MVSQLQNPPFRRDCNCFFVYDAHLTKISERGEKTMAAFFKSLPKKSRRAILISIALLVVSVTLLVFNTAPLFAWFIKGERYNRAGVDVAMIATRYELLVQRTTEYDNTVGYPGVATSGGLKSRLAEAGYHLTHTSTVDSAGIAFELVNEFVYDELYYLMPGTYGTLTFYVKPNTGYENLQLDLRLQIGGYHTVYDEHNVSSLDPVTSETVLDLLQGHLLFFKGRTGANYANYKYTDFIDDGVIEFSTAGRTPTQIGGDDCYEVTLYWEWPATYYDIADHVNEQNGTTEKYPYEVGVYMDTNREYFFASNANSNDPQELSNGYDDGDQNIGNNVEYIVVYIAEDNG